MHANSFQLREIPVPKGRRYEALIQIGLGPALRFIPYPLARLATTIKDHDGAVTEREKAAAQVPNLDPPPAFLVPDAQTLISVVVRFTAILDAPETQALAAQLRIQQTQLPNLFADAAAIPIRETISCVRMRVTGVSRSIG